MGVSREVRLQCDGCGDIGDAAGSQVRDVRRWERARGWVRRDGRDLCPRCVEGVERRG